MEVGIPSKYKVVRRNQEKLPLAAEGSYRDHGTIPGGREYHNDNLPNGRAIQASKSTKESPKNQESMSLKRKLVFVMSFNVWVLYFATLLWVVPCHSDSCQKRKDWIFVLPEAELLTNLEAQRSDIGDLVTFGYRNYTALGDVKGTIIALSASNGTPLWTELLSFAPSTLLHTALSREANWTNDAGRLLAMGKTGMALVNISQGNVLWSQTFHSGSLTPTISPVVLRCSSDEFRLLYSRENIGEVFIGVLNFATGRRMVTFRSPCSDNLRTGLHIITSAGQSQAFIVCGFRRAAGIWAVSKEEICNPEEDTETFTNVPYAGTFSIGDIELLGQDLTTLSDGTNLVLGWRNTLATISVGSKPFSLKWRKNFDDLRIRSFVIGHFSSEDERQIAVAFEGEFSGARVDVLKLSNGEKIASASVPTGSVKSLKAITRDRADGKIESVLVETVLPEEPSLKVEPTASFTNESFFLVTFGRTVTVNKLLTTETNNGRRLSSDLAGSDDLRLVTAEAAANESLKIVGRRLTLTSLCTS